MNCEMCGKEGRMFRAVVEGVSMAVCQACGKYGRIEGEIRESPKKEPKKQKDEPAEDDSPELVQSIVGNYASVVKNAREKAGLKQEELAKKLNEKESIIHKIESSHMHMSIGIARKLEKFLKIKLVEEIKLEKEKPKEKSSSEGMTIGDIIKKVKPKTTNQ